MQDLVNIGSVPTDEDCLQVGNSLKQQRLECNIYINQILRYYPAPEEARLIVKGNSHDFGTYFEVEAQVNMSNQQERSWAFDIEGDILGVLQFWDEEAKEEIAQAIESGQLPPTYPKAD